MRHISAFVVIATLAGLAGAACSSAPGDGAQSAGQAVVISPEAGTEQAVLTVSLPADACQPGTACAKVLGHTANVFVDGQSVALNAGTVLTAGTHTLAVNNIGTSITLSPGENETLLLPVVVANCTSDPLPDVPPTDFGETVSVSNAACPTSVQGPSSGLPSPNWNLYFNAQCDINWTLSPSLATEAYCSSNAYGLQTFSSFNDLPTGPEPTFVFEEGVCTPTGAGVPGCDNAVNLMASQPGSNPGVGYLGNAYEAFVPTTISASVNGTSQSLTLNSGDEVEFPFDLPVLGTVPPTFQTTLSFLSPRVNPDAARGTITSSCSGDRTYTIPSGTTTDLTLNAFVNSGCTYTLNVGGRSVVLSQTSANAISLNRLDVNDVTVTSDVDGGTTSVQASYTLDFGGVQVAGPYTTPSGVDVLPGTYGFVLNFTDVNGAETETQTITF